MARISILMGIYNCADTLKEAVECIAAQTFSDWELILCDDGSTDATKQVAAALAADDERIILLQNEKNCGLPKTLNRCARVATAEVFARMDADDRCAADRLQKEWEIICAGEYDIVSCGMEFFDENGVYGKKIYVEMPQKSDFAGNSPFCHAGAMFTRKAFDAVGGYSEDASRLRVEDFDLWFRMYQAGFRGRNLSECLYSMRDDRSALRRKKYRYRVNEYRLKKQIARAFDFGFSGQLHAVRPLILGLCPSFVYRILHRAKLGGVK